MHNNQQLYNQPLGFIGDLDPDGKRRRTDVTGYKNNHCKPLQQQKCTTCISSSVFASQFHSFHLGLSVYPPSVSRLVPEDAIVSSLSACLPMNLPLNGGVNVRHLDDRALVNRRTKKTRRPGCPVGSFVGRASIIFHSPYLWCGSRVNSGTRCVRWMVRPITQVSERNGQFNSASATARRIWCSYTPHYKLTHTRLYSTDVVFCIARRQRLTY